MSQGAKRKLLLVAVVALPSVVLRAAGVHLRPEVASLVFGAGVVASAFLLAWAAEAAQVDISGSLAIALLALIAVLPEYAVDLYFAFTAGHRPDFTQYAAANMTGSNRLLIGIGWPLVAFVAIAAWRRAHGRPAPEGEEDARTGAVVLPDHRRIEVGFLAAASLYAFVIPLTRRLAWYDSVVLLGLFGAYLWRTSREERGEPDLVGLAAEVGGLPSRPRRAIVVSLFAAAGVVVVAAAEPFANGLVGTGDVLGVDKFLLVQWLAPLASEAPELIVATLFALRLRGDDALGTLLSSKVNQWTLLVGSLPIAYLLGGGGGALHLDARQTEEFLLTGAQAVLGIAVLAELSLSRREAVALLALFALQFPFPSTGVRLAFSAVYLGLAGGILAFRRRQMPATLRAMVRPTPHAVPGPQAGAGP